jgi:hypothetical protein
MKQSLILLLGLLLCSGGITTASAESHSVNTVCRRHHRHWVPGHYYWRHHHRHYVPGHWVW